MTLINLHVYESEIKPCPIYIYDCTTGPVSPSAGGEDESGRNIEASEVGSIVKIAFLIGMPHTYLSVLAVTLLHPFGLKGEILYRHQAVQSRPF